MQRPNLAIFANFFIDNEERFMRLKDSFYSFKNSNPDQWVINIRGRFKSLAGDFLKKELGNNLELSFLQSKNGWQYDSLKISNKINCLYVFFWIEDHIFLKDPKILNSCIKEMHALNVDQLWYSWFKKNTRSMFSIIEPETIEKHITVTKLDLESIIKIKKNLKRNFYLISCPSIMSKNFFIKVLSSKKPFLKRWPRHLPFDFEKKSNDFVAPIIRHALPNQELFAAIDDDHGEPGYSLISRGLYPNRVSREEIKSMEFGSKTHLKEKLIKLIPKKIKPIFATPKNLLNRILYTLNIL